jgi:hypothetical protein
MICGVDFVKKLFLKFTALILTIVIILSFSGCNLFYDDVSSKSKQYMKSLISKLESEDVEGVKALFAPNKIADIPDFDETVQALIDYYNGSFVSMTGTAGEGSSLDKTSGIDRKWYDMSYDVTTTTEVFRISTEWYIKAVENKEDVGIWSLSIIKYNDDPAKQKTYWGDGTSFYGIQIGKIHVNNYFDKLCLQLKSNNASGIKNVFAPEIAISVQNIDEQIAQLLDFCDLYLYNDEDIFYNALGCKYYISENNAEFYEISYEIFVVETDICYNFALRWCVADETLSDNVGLWSLYVIKDDEYNSDELYWGDGLWTNGINIYATKEQTISGYHLN